MDLQAEPSALQAYPPVQVVAQQMLAMQWAFAHWLSVEQVPPFASFGVHALPLQKAVDAQSVSAAQAVLQDVVDAHARLPGQAVAGRHVPLVEQTESELTLQPAPQDAPALG